MCSRTDRQTDMLITILRCVVPGAGAVTNAPLLSPSASCTGTDAWHATAVLFQQRSDAKLSRSVPIALHNITVVGDFYWRLQMIVKCGMNNCRSLCWPRILIPPTRMYSCNGSLLRQCARVSVREHISGTHVPSSPNFCAFTYGCCSVLLWRRCDALCNFVFTVTSCLHTVGDAKKAYTLSDSAEAARI